MVNAMHINLRLDCGKLIEQRVDAPCKGLLAKAIGSYRLGEELEGTQVEFVSYQEGPGLPEKPLADDDTVSRGAILNFSVQMDTFLQQHHKHTKQIKGLHLLLVKPQLQILISKYVSRFFNPPVTETTGSTAMKALVLATPDLSASIGAALTSVGSGLSSPEFAEQLDLNYKNCKDVSHVETSDEQLRQEFKAIVASGALENLEELMPVKCLIASHHELFLQLLPGNQAR